MTADSAEERLDNGCISSVRQLALELLRRGRDL